MNVARHLANPQRGRPLNESFAGIRGPLARNERARGQVPYRGATQELPFRSRHFCCDPGRVSHGICLGSDPDLAHVTDWRSEPHRPGTGCRVATAIAKASRRLKQRGGECPSWIHRSGARQQSEWRINPSSRCDQAKPTRRVRSCARIFLVERRRNRDLGCETSSIALTPTGGDS